MSLTLYHGAAGISAGSIINDWVLRPRSSIITRRTLGYGPIGFPECVYLSDTFAIASAFHAAERDEQTTCQRYAAVAEVEIDESFLSVPYVRRKRANILIPDYSFYLLRKYPQLDWKTSHTNRAAIHEAEHLLDPREPRDFSWEQSYEEMGNLGVWLGAGVEIESLPVTRVLLIDLQEIDFGWRAYIDQIEPSPFYDLDTLQELRQFHLDLFASPPSGMKVLTSPVDSILTYEANPPHEIATYEV